MKKQKPNGQFFNPASNSRKAKNLYSEFSLLIAGLFILSCLTTSCKKTDYAKGQEQALANAIKQKADATDLTNPIKEHPFAKVLYKKWVTISQLVDPVWVYPETGEKYTDVWDFTKEYFPWVVDDANEFVPDSSINNGFIYIYNGKYRYDPTQSYKDPSVYRYKFDEKTDSLYFIGLTDVYGNIVTLPAKVLELTNLKITIRFVQVLPFTYTTHIATETYQWNPLYDIKYRNADPIYYTQGATLSNELHKPGHHAFPIAQF